MNGYKDIKTPIWVGREIPKGIVFGFDNQLKKDVKVEYRRDSNRFFDYPYTGAVYPINRMHFWKPI